MSDADADGFTCPEEGCDFVGASERAVDSHVAQGHRGRGANTTGHIEALLELDPDDVPSRDEVAR